MCDCMQPRDCQSLNDPVLPTIQKQCTHFLCNQKEHMTVMHMLNTSSFNTQLIHSLKCKHDTQHLVRSFGRVLPPHFQREDNALVPLNGNAGHCEDACHYGCGLNKRNCLANQNPCRKKVEGTIITIEKQSIKTSTTTSVQTTSFVGFGTENKGELFPCSSM